MALLFSDRLTAGRCLQPRWATAARQGLFSFFSFLSPFSGSVCLHLPPPAPRAKIRVSQVVDIWQVPQVCIRWMSPELWEVSRCPEAMPDKHTAWKGLLFFLFCREKGSLVELSLIHRHSDWCLCLCRGKFFKVPPRSWGFSVSLVLLNWSYCLNMQCCAFSR